MKKILKQSLVILLGILLIYVTGRYCKWLATGAYTDGYDAGFAAGLKKIMTIEQLQKNLAEDGFYDGPVDGRVGPKTIKAWDKAICEMYAADADKRIYGGE